MAYERQYYTNGDVLDARQLNHMETGIKENSDNIGKLSEEIDNLSSTEIVELKSSDKLGFLSNEGEYISSKHWFLTDFIDMSKIVSFMIVGNDRISKVRIYFYDENKNFVAYLEKTDTHFVQVAVSKLKGSYAYFNASFYSENEISESQDYSLYLINKKCSDLRKRIADDLLINSEIANIRNNLIRGTVDSSKGEFYQQWTSIVSEDLVPNNIAGNIITIESPCVMRLYYYDSNGVFIKRSDAGQSVNVEDYPYFKVQYYISNTIPGYDDTRSKINIVYLDNPECIEIPLFWENGALDGAGKDAESLKRIRTNKIPSDENSLYLVVFPSEYYANVNVKMTELSDGRFNLKSYNNAPFSFKGAEDFIRITVMKSDNSEFSVSDIDTAQFHLYKIKTSGDYDCVVGHENSINVHKADIIVNDYNCQQIIQALYSCINSIRFKILGGIYPMNTMYTTNFGEKSVLYTNVNNYFAKQIEIVGEYNSNGKWDNPSIILSDTNSIADSNDTEQSIMLVARLEDNPESVLSSYVNLVIDGLTVLGTSYEKPVVGINAIMADTCRLSNCYVRHDGIEGMKKGLYVFPTRPNKNCVGIRVGRGSNTGTKNYIKNSAVYFCGKGYSVCGEHYILEDCLAHHCFVGFAFGDLLTRGNYEHPNIMIGCSIEGSYRLMELSRYGVTEDTTAQHANNTLICVGLSTEYVWNIPIDELQEGQAETMYTLPIKEVVKGLYRGRVELDYPTNPFEEGSCIHMKYTRYSADGIEEGIGNN